MARPVLSFDADQQTSAVDKKTIQNDRWRTEEITSGHGQKFTLLAVVDGEGETKPGEAANLAVDIAFAEARLRRYDSLHRLLRHLLSQMNEVLYQNSSGDMVGVTLAAIEDNRVWLAQAGSQTRCYRVRGTHPAQLLTRDNSVPLGRQASLPAPEVTAHKLKTGDKLVLCSDGLYAGDLVSPADMAKIERYDDIKGAARHLSALAMGRNVRDNVTVLVTAYGRGRRLRLRSLIIDALGVLLAVLIVLLLAYIVIPRLRPVRPADVGVAYVADQLDVVNPKEDLPAGGLPLHVILKKRESLESSYTATLPALGLSFGPGTHANLAAIDVEGFEDPFVGIKEPVDLTEVELYDGRALILSRHMIPGSNPRTFYVWLGSPSDELESPRIVLEGDSAAVGVDRQGDQATAYCLEGSCSLRMDKQLGSFRIGSEAVSFPAGTKISLEVGSTPLDSLASEALDATDAKVWYSLCSSWQSAPAAVQAMCETLNPSDYNP